MLIAPFGAITRANWVIIWSFLELRSFRFISILKKKNREERIKYFLVQTLGSITLLLCINLKINGNRTINILNLFMPMLMIFSLALKRGVAPIHFWIPEISRNIKIKSLGAFLSIQKLAPLFILINNCKIKIATIFIIFSIILGTLRQLSSLNINILLSYSSVSHTRWIILAGLLSNQMYFIYFSVYTIILILILYSLRKFNSSVLFRKDKTLSLILNLLSFRGVPPLLGFFPKWMVILSSISWNRTKIIVFLLIVLSCINIYIYIRIFTLKTVNEQEKEKEKKSYNKRFLLSSMLNFFPISIFLFYIL